MISDIKTAITSAKIKLDTHVSNRDRLMRRKGVIQSKLDLMPEVKDVLDRMYSECNGQTIQEYERIISDGLAEIIGDDSKVSMTLKTKNNALALSVMSEKKGRKGSIMEGEGGGLTNVVCLGLRVISVARSNMRRFMLLDEPDCWLDDGRVIPFFGMIEEISHSGFQIIALTHHDISDMTENMNVITVKQGENGSIVQQAEIPHFPENLPGIRSIRLENFACYKDQTFYLSPDLNIIDGESNVGKSRVMRALNCVIFNEGNDGDIFFIDEDNHERWCRVTIELERKRKLIWRRRVNNYSGNEAIKDMDKVEHFQLIDEDGNVVILDDGTICSDNTGHWVGRKEVMNIRYVLDKEKVSPHLSNQKSPIYMLDKTESQQASILSLSHEAVKIQELMKKSNMMIKEYKADIRSLDDEISSCSKFIKVLDSYLPGLLKIMKDIEELDGVIQTKTRFIEGASGLRMRYLENRQVISLLHSRSYSIPQKPDLKNVDGMLSMAINYDGILDKLDVIQQALQVKLPSSQNLHHIDDMGSMLNAFQRNKSILALKVEIIVPEKIELTNNISIMTTVLKSFIYNKDLISLKKNFLFPKIPDIIQNIDDMNVQYLSALHHKSVLLLKEEIFVPNTIKLIENINNMNVEYLKYCKNKSILSLKKDIRIPDKIILNDNINQMHNFAGKFQYHASILALKTDIIIPVDGSVLNVDNMKSLYKDFNKNKAIVKLIHSQGHITTPQNPEIKDIYGLVDLLKKMIRTKKTQEILSAYKVGALKAPSLYDVDKMLSLGFEHGNNYEVYVTIKDALKKIKIPSSPSIIDINNLNFAITQYDNGCDNKKEIERESLKCKNRILTLNHEIDTIKDHLGVCPTCGQHMSSHTHS